MGSWSSLETGWQEGHVCFCHHLRCGGSTNITASRLFSVTPDFCRNGKLAGSTCCQGPAAGLTVVLPANLPPKTKKHSLLSQPRTREVQPGLKVTEVMTCGCSLLRRPSEMAWPLVQPPPSQERGSICPGPSTRREQGETQGSTQRPPNTRTKDAADAAAPSGRGRASQKLKGPPPSRDAKGTCHK